MRTKRSPYSEMTPVEEKINDTLFTRLARASVIILFLFDLLIIYIGVSLCGV